MRMDIKYSPGARSCRQAAAGAIKVRPDKGAVIRAPRPDDAESVICLCRSTIRTTLGSGKAPQSRVGSQFGSTGGRGKMVHYGFNLGSPAANIAPERTGGRYATRHAGQKARSIGAEARQPKARLYRLGYAGQASAVTCGVVNDLSGDAVVESQCNTRDSQGLPALIG
jgi:hypothetical protein